MCHEIGEEQMLLELAILEVVGKVPSCHLLTRGLARREDPFLLPEDLLEAQGRCRGRVSK